MTRAQRIAVGWFRRRSFRFRFIMFVPIIPDVASLIPSEPGAVIIVGRREQPRMATRAEVRRMADQFRWPEGG